MLQQQQQQTNTKKIENIMFFLTMAGPSQRNYLLSKKNVPGQAADHGLESEA
jgi:hypothetical protein